MPRKLHFRRSLISYREELGAPKLVGQINDHSEFVLGGKLNGVFAARVLNDPPGIREALLYYLGEIAGHVCQRSKNGRRRPCQLPKTFDLAQVHGCEHSIDDIFWYLASDRVHQIEY